MKMTIKEKEKYLIFTVFLLIISASASAVQADTLSSGVISVAHDGVYSGTYSYVKNTATAGTAAGSTFNIHTFSFYNSAYNNMRQLTLSFNPGYFHFNRSAESTSFTITGGGTGSGVFTYYNSGYLSWDYNAGSVLTGSTITLSYANEQVISNITVTGGGGNSGDCGAQTGCAGLKNMPILGITQPMMIGSGLVGYEVCGAYCSPDTIYPFTYSIWARLTVNVPYSLFQGNNNLFTFYGNKTAGSVLTNINLTNESNGVYARETVGTYNNNFYSPSFYVTAAQIWVNISTQSNDFTKTLIYSSGNINTPTNATGTILFNKSGYDRYSDFNFSWNIINKNSNNGYYAVLKNSDTSATIATYPLSTASGTMVIKNSMLLTPDQNDYYEINLIERTNLYISNFLGFGQAYYGSTQQSPNSSVTGNFSILNANKTLIQGSYLNLKYNLSSSGRIVIYDRVREYNYNIPAATNTNYSIFIPNTFEISGSTIYLQYYDSFAGDYMTLYSDVFFVLPLSDSSLTVLKDVYYQGDVITGHAYNSNTGLINIMDPDGSVIYNQSIPAGSVYTYTYQTSLSSKRGTWTVYLYDNTGVLLQTVSTYLNQGMAAATPTPAGISAPPVTLIDAGSSISDAIFGKWTDENGEVSDVMIKKQGNSMFGVIFMIAFICLIAGAYWKIKGKR